MNNQLPIQGDFLETAGNMLERYDNQDHPTPGLLELASHNQIGMATSSGLNDYDYQALEHLSLGQKEITQVQTLNRLPIPTEILDHFKHVKCHCMMGLFPEIGRAWLTIDSELYIWTFEQARDVAYFDGVTQVITGVGLIKPKAKVFVRGLTYLLVVCTAFDIIILGATFGNAQPGGVTPDQNNMDIFEEMHLMPRPVFSVGTDGSPITVVKGTKQGRIFLGGKDGCLYEICYKAESSWFGSRCRKVNHSQSFISLVMPSFLKVFSETDPISDMVVDDERNLLFILTEKGAIEVWDLGIDGSDTRRICKANRTDIAYTASNVIRTVDPSVFKAIKSLCVIPEDTCFDVNLLAVTQCGVRLYFSTLSPNYLQQLQQQNALQQQNQMQQAGNMPNYQQQQPTQQQSQTLPQAAQPMNNNPLTEEFKHQGLYLKHVRLPPGYTPSSTINRPRDVHFAYYNEGTILMASTSQQEQDILWSISSALFPHHSYLIESTTILSMDGIVHDIAEVLDYNKSSRLHSIVRKSKRARKVAVLTNQGVHFYSLLKPVDILQQLLYANQGPHHENIKVFFQTISEPEACATCLLLACSEEHRGTDLALWASQAFMLYGGEPHYQLHGNINPQGPYRNPANTSFLSGGLLDRNNPNVFMSTPMQNYGSQALTYRTQQTPLQNPAHQTQYMYNPMQSQSGTVSNVPPLNEAKTLSYSYRHDGLYIHVSRILRPVWKKKCVINGVESTISLEDCSLILEDLLALKSFFEANSLNEFNAVITTSYASQASLNNYTNGFSSIYPNNNLSVADQRILNEQAQAEEKRSLVALTYFIKHVCEYFALWKILLENNFPFLVMDLTTEQQAILKNIRFKDMILTRFDMCAWLIVALVNSYLNDNSSVNIISGKLRQSCPNMYRHEDAVTYKATELLIAAKATKSADEKQEKLHWALKLCKDAAPNLPLQTLCSQFTAVGFYKGVIELCSAVANKLDPEEYGIHYYKSDEPTDDRDGYTAYIARMNVYKEVRSMLDSVYQVACSKAEERRQNPSKSRFADEAEDDKSDQLELQRIISMSINTKDPILHVCIYEWLLSHDKVSDLLSLSEPSLGEYLRRNVMRNPKDYRLIDLLWKYYEKNGHHTDAAKILDNLATLESDDINMDQRIEYLARAVMCMRNESLGYSVANGVLLKELEDKLEIARVQKFILDTIKALIAKSSDPQRQNLLKAAAELNRSLYDISQLYEHFADHYNLWECKLRILNCSNHNDPLLIESIWCEIINGCVEGSNSAQEQCTKLFTKMEGLFKHFMDSGHCFPLAFLIKYLEITACKYNFPPGIVPDKLAEMDIDIELLMEYYLRMISMNERVWTSEGNEWHLMDSAIHVVSILLKNLHLLSWNRNRRRILLKGQDVISQCLTQLYQKPGTERLQHDLRDLQCRLQRALA